MSARRSTTRGRSARPPLVELPPSRTQTVRAADGTPLHAEVFGPPDGYPIVLTHGFVCAIRAWSYQIADLATDYRVIAFDHRGHGRSGVPRRGGYSLKHLASDLDCVLDATLAPHERALIAGHSMGGMTIAGLVGTLPPQGSPARRCRRVDQHGQWGSAAQNQAAFGAEGIVAGPGRGRPDADQRRGWISASGCGPDPQSAIWSR